MQRQCVIHREMALSPSLVQLKHHWISRPSDTLPPSHSQSYRFAACGREFPSLLFLHVKPRTFLVHSEIVQPQVVSLGMFYRTNKKVQHKPQALMCYRNNTLLSTIVQAEVLEREKKYIYRSPAEKEERCQKRQMDFTYTPRIALHPEKINK